MITTTEEHNILYAKGLQAKTTLPTINIHKLLYTGDKTPKTTLALLDALIKNEDKKREGEITHPPI